MHDAEERGFVAAAADETAALVAEAEDWALWLNVGGRSYRFGVRSPFPVSFSDLREEHVHAFLAEADEEGVTWEA